MYLTTTISENADTTWVLGYEAAHVTDNGYGMCEVFTVRNGERTIYMALSRAEALALAVGLADELNINSETQPSSAASHQAIYPGHTLADGTFPDLPYTCLNCGENFAD